MKPHLKIVERITVPSKALIILLKSKDGTKIFLDKIQYLGLTKVYLHQAYQLCS
jgi:hypothetical protein